MRGRCEAAGGSKVSAGGGEVVAEGAVVTAMASASSSSLSSRRRRLFVLLITCPSCNVKTIVTCTAKTYANRGHGFGCNFWYWEEGYINYLKRNGYIAGEDGAYGKTAQNVDLDEDAFVRQDEIEKKLIAKLGGV
uniref:Uncharacterized protein n=1 Tax=Oryza rufipogon TaxID=4529 RepID=A0A0E0QYI3_ORYRU